MTDRKFTPPTEFPAEYVTSDGRKAVILNTIHNKKYPYLGYIQNEDDDDGAYNWSSDGGAVSSKYHLHDIPKKQVLWCNDYGWFTGGSWFRTREDADKVAIPNRIAVIRREWIEGQTPQHFTEEV